MPDTLQKRASHDRHRIHMGEPHEVRYWTGELGVDADTLLRAVNKVGNAVVAVREYLKSKGR
jgi:hypothetical protein